MRKAECGMWRDGTVPPRRLVSRYTLRDARGARTIVRAPRASCRREAPRVSAFHGGRIGGRHARRALPRVLNLREADDREEAEVEPSDVELEPAVSELRGARVGVVVVVQLLAAEPDGDRRDVAALARHGVVAVAERGSDAVQDPGR